MAQKIKSIEPLVYQLLSIDRTFSDCDERLVATVWYNCIKSEVNNMSAMSLLEMYTKGKLPSSESITRCRRKLEELHPELRGKDYLKRHSNKKQREVINEINTIG